VTRTLSAEEQFSSKWMVRVDARTPEQITSGQQELRKKHDELLASKTQDGLTTTDDSGNVLGDD